MKAFHFSQHSSSPRLFHLQQKHRFEWSQGDNSAWDLQSPTYAPAPLPAGWETITLPAPAGAGLYTARRSCASFCSLNSSEWNNSKSMGLGTYFSYFTMLLLEVFVLFLSALAVLRGWWGQSQTVGLFCFVFSCLDLSENQKETDVAQVSPNIFTRAVRRFHLY